MADWSIVFAETLEAFWVEYDNACGDGDERAMVLKRCRDAIRQSPKVKKDGIELPDFLRQAIRREFLPYLDNDDQAEEEAAIKAAEDQRSEKLTADERISTARPTDAGDYRKLWDPFRVAQWIFKEEVNKINEGARDKSDKKNFSARTRVLRKWWNNLDVARKQEAERVAATWNAQGAPPEKQAAYRKKNLRNDTSEFVDSLRQTMGVHAIVLVAYKAVDGVKTTIIEAIPPPGRTKSFSVFSNESKKWAKDGCECLTDYVFGKDEEHSESDGEEDGDDESVPVVNVDINGNPLLPQVSSRRQKARQHVVREIFRKAYIKITTRAKVSVPWLLLSKMPMEYIDAASIPAGFRITDPSKFTKIGIETLWSHWHERESQGLPILSFIKARSEDLPARQAPLEFHPSKKRPYVEIDPVSASTQHDAAGDDLVVEDLARKGKAKAPSAAGPPPKRPRHSLDDQPSDPEESSPLANQLDRGTFLQSLSNDSSYAKLVVAVHALPRIPSQRPKSMGSLPVWASWGWAKKYLPTEIHMVGDEFRVTLGALRRTRFSDAGSGTPVILGFGLLLRECWRAVEAEPDGEPAPDFVTNSILGFERLQDVVSAIKEILANLPAPLDNTLLKDTGEMDLGGAENLKRTDEQGGESSNVKEDHPTHEPAADSRSSGRSPKKPVRNTRDQSKRVCKPTKRVLGSA